MMTKKRENEREYKTYPIFITKVDEDQGIVDAIVSVFGVFDGYDVVENGAFAKTIIERGRRVKVLDAHNSWSSKDVIGKPLEMREISRDELPSQVLEQFPEATGGLFTKTQYLLDTPEGNGIFKRIKADAVNEYSIGYQVMQHSYRKIKLADGTEVDARILKEIRLWEYSPVIWGMNPATATVGAKGHRDEKEMTAQGAIMRMGDYLQGRMRYTMESCANEWLMYGKIGSEDHAQIRAAVEAGVKAFVAALPEALALTQINPRPSYYYDNLAMDGESKALPVDNKAGRVLSERNARLIKDAYLALGDVMQSAGLIEDESADAENADAEEGKAAPAPIDSKSSESPTQAGPGAPVVTIPPTDETRKRLLLEIDGELDDISILEAQ